MGQVPIYRPIIMARGMEGFDWPKLGHMLTLGLGEYGPSHPNYQPEMSGES